MEGKEQKAQSMTVTISVEGERTRIWNGGGMLCVRALPHQDGTLSEAICGANTKANVVARMILKAEEMIAQIKRNNPDVANWCDIYTAQKLLLTIGGDDNE